jgi:gliding motility-associated-like protein
LKKENMYLTKNLLTLLVLLILAGSAQAQNPNWAVDPSNYQYSMTATAFLTVNGNVLTSEQDKAAAFVNNEVRGVANVIYAESPDRYLAYITIYANAENEAIEFKIYDSSNNAIVDVAIQLNFKIDDQLGTVFQAFSLASPALNNEAKIKDFSFTGVDSVSTIITANQVDIVLEYDENLTNLMPEFVLSNGARMYLDKVVQESGAEIIDFTDTVAYSVLSQDESVLSTYQVTANNRKIVGDGDFFSTNVITANGDGQNDYWIVQDVFKYSGYSFKIFDVNGRILFESIGYNNEWGGSYKGKRLDTGKYYFVITNMETNTSIKGDILVLY